MTVLQSASKIRLNDHFLCHSEMHSSVFYNINVHELCEEPMCMDFKFKGCLKNLFQNFIFRKDFEVLTYTSMNVCM